MSQFDAPSSRTPVGDNNPARPSGNQVIARPMWLRAVARIWRWTHEHRELRFYGADRLLADRYERDSRVACNSVRDLLAFEPGAAWQTRDRFLAEAMARMERGESVYTIRSGERLASYGWLVRNQTQSHPSEVDMAVQLAAGGVGFYDFFTHPSFRNRGNYRALLCHMLVEAFTDPGTRHVYVYTLASNHASRHVIEALGFEYERSLHWRRHFGRVHKWADPSPSP